MSILDLSFHGFSQLFIDFLGNFNKQTHDKFISDVVSLSHIENHRERNKVLAERYAYNIRTNPIVNSLIAGSIIIENIRNNSPKTTMEYAISFQKTLSPEAFSFMCVHSKEIDNFINHKNDYTYSWFAVCTLMKTYLLKKSYDTDTCETPQQMYVRVAIALAYKKGIEEVKRIYKSLSEKNYTHASPTLFNGGTNKGQMASCYLLSIKDSLDDIYDVLKESAMYSKGGGGIGINLTNIRHSAIGNTGFSSGIKPLLDLYNASVKYVDQGGRRPGAATLFLRTHHIDIENFIDSIDNISGSAHDIYISIWTSDLFWERVESNGKWTLFCPKQTPRLNNVYGETFKKWYEYYENECNTNPSEGFKFKTIKAVDLVNKIVRMQRKRGMPFIFHADNVNRKNNQQNIGNINNSNLCQEICQYSSDRYTASCNLASISLKKMSENGFFNFKLLGEMTRELVRNLNYLIDNNPSSCEKAKRSNEDTRAIAIGVSGFDDMVRNLSLKYGDDELYLLNRKIWACMYFNALLQSMLLAKEEDPYPYFIGSPLSNGVFQFDMYAHEEDRTGRKYEFQTSDNRTYNYTIPIDPSEWGQDMSLLDIKVTQSLKDSKYQSKGWDILRGNIKTYGVRNSLLLAVMPTASTAQVLDNAECTEPHMKNMYQRVVGSGNYIVFNKFMIQEFINNNYWKDDVIDFILGNNGSIVGISNKYEQLGLDKKFAEEIESKYKTVSEISQKIFCRLSAERQVYIDHSQSLNIYIDDPTDKQLIALHLHTWKLGLKTGMYYLRTRPASETVKFTANEENNKKQDSPKREVYKNKDQSELVSVCTKDCLSCS